MMMKAQTQILAVCFVVAALVGLGLFARQQSGESALQVPVELAASNESADEAAQFIEGLYAPGGHYAQSIVLGSERAVVDGTWPEGSARVYTHDADFSDRGEQRCAALDVRVRSGSGSTSVVCSEPGDPVLAAGLSSPTEGTARWSALGAFLPDEAVKLQVQTAAGGTLTTNVVDRTALLIWHDDADNAPVSIAALDAAGDTQWSKPIEAISLPPLPDNAVPATSEPADG